VQNVGSGTCLEVTGGATANSSPLEISGCTGAVNQEWDRA
jgi:hypothetical protein